METKNNKRKRALLYDTADRKLRESLKTGFFGTICLKVSIQDGSIQNVKAQVTEDLK